MRARRVTVNGRPADRPGLRIRPGVDDVRVDGRRVRPPPKILVAFHKPRGVLCTVRDPARRPCYADFLRGAGLPRLFYAGRLDADSEGLLLLTNDGDLCARLIHPRHGVLKTYLVWTDRPLPPEWRARFLRGVDSEGERLSAVEVEPWPAGDAHAVRIVLSEGRKRQIRRMMAAAGLRVRRLLRVRIGPVELGALRPGRWRRLSDAEAAAVRRTAGLGPTAG